MFDRKILKERAKITLSRSYFIILIACVIVNITSSVCMGVLSGKVRKVQFMDMTSIPYYRIMAILAVISLMALIVIALSIFVIYPLQVGLKYFMLQNEIGDSRLDNLLFPFRTSYKNITFAMFMKNLIIFLWSLFSIIPIIIGMWKFGLADKLVILTTKMNMDTASIRQILSVSGSMFVLTLFILLFSVPAIIKQLQYSMTEYILADDPDLEWRTAMEKSKEMMVGNKCAYVKLIISFLPWYIAANLFCCIGSTLLMPYIESTLAQLYLELSGRNMNI